MYTTAERRAKPRIECDCTAIVEGFDGNGLKYSDQGKLINLSASGLFMRINREIDHGSKIDVTILLDKSYSDLDAPKLSTNGIVVRKEPMKDGTCGVAVKFNHYRFL